MSLLPRERCTTLRWSRSRTPSASWATCLGSETCSTKPSTSPARHSPFMAKVFYIWWDELDRRDMPNHCMMCGRKKAKWVAYAFMTTRYEYGRNYRVTRKTEIPLCSEHAGGWWKTVQARDFDKQGVW